MAAGCQYGRSCPQAVGNAGGIGFMCAVQWIDDIKKFEDELKKIKDLTDKPYGINVTCSQRSVKNGLKRYLI